jgi:hypothetical protein
MVWTGLICLQMGTSRRSCELGDGPLGFINCWKILEWLSDWQILKKDSVHGVGWFVWLACM